MTWRERLRPGRLLGYGLKGPDRQRSFFWTVIFVGLFPAIWFGYLLHAIARRFTALTTGSWRAFREVRPRALRRMPHSLAAWARPAARSDAAARNQQLIWAGGWLLLTGMSATLLVFVRPVAPGEGLALTLFAVACVTRVIVHVVTWRWMRAGPSARRASM